MVNEELTELKNIPYGKEFSNLLSIYKVVPEKIAMNYKYGYDRKQSAGWDNSGRDSYGIVGYTHLELSGAKQMLGYHYGTSIVQFKLLGGLKGFVFFNTDRDSKIKRLQIEAYGRELDLYGQLLELTGDRRIAERYGRREDPTSFGKFYQHEIRKMGKYVRGMVCDYWGDTSDIVVYPFKFSDMITCAIANGLNSSMSDDEIKRRFTGVLGQEEREKQNTFLDIVPHLEMVNAYDPDGAQYIRVGDKAYATYNSPMGPNILIIDDENWDKPNDVKLFPDDVRIDEVPSNISRKGNFTFKMNGIVWSANVIGQVNGKQYTDDNSPIFSVKGSDQWFGWENLSYMFQNPDWVKENLLNVNRQFSDYDDPFNDSSTELNEAFSQGMTLADFTANNKAIGYVCTHQYSLKSVLEHGFSREWAAENDSNYNGGRGFYGNGVYGCVTIGKISAPNDPEFNGIGMNDAGAARLSFYRDHSKQDGLKYGDIILKCSIVGGWNRFLIFDEYYAKKVYRDKWQIEDQIRQIFGDKSQREAEYLIREMSTYEGFKYNVSDNDTRTTPPLARLFRGSLSDFQKYEKLFRKYGIRGAIYHGGNDGYCFVCYDYSEVIPIAVSHDHGKTFSTDEINWRLTHDRLATGGDPVAKLSAKYQQVSSFPKKVSVDDVFFGVVNVQKQNGKYNCVRMDTLKEIFPIDFDYEPSVGANGLVRFVYHGYNFVGKVYNRQYDMPTFFYPDKNGDEYGFDSIDAVISYYIEGGGESENSGENEYEIADDNTENLQESFFRFLDKIELL